ncbi:MAG: radical SAM protein [Synergistaceae bacterium]|jgi:pyruvate formate lyase activating enzyme|nr:radical SAM protein [Synergistaceae bacterium]
MIKTRWWHKEGEGARCGLCFRRCLISAGKMGYCGARRWDEGIFSFSSPWLGCFSSCAIDPIEKKPLYHWRPGSFIFSLGSLGCNMRCPFCQNHGIAQLARAKSVPLVSIAPGELVNSIKKEGLTAVAFTYNEPTLQAEYILEAAPLLKSEDIAIALVTNGMFSTEALDDLTPWIDATNVDVKTFNPVVYSALGGSLDTVKANIARLTQKGVHVELTNLVVPGISDSREDFIRMTDWIVGLSRELPLHISRYFPAHRYTAPPTDVGLMKTFESIAKSKLKHVHLSNV